MEPCKLLPHYSPSFTKLPLWRSQIWSIYFLIEAAFWKMENNEVGMCKVSLWGSQIWSTYFLIKEALGKMENDEKAMCKVPIRILFIYIFRCIYWRIISRGCLRDPKWAISLRNLRISRFCKSSEEPKTSCRKVLPCDLSMQLRT